MKQFLLIPVLIFLNQILFAQETNIKKHEIGVNLVYMTDYGTNYSDWQLTNGDKFVVNYVTGLMYKRNWKKNSLRISLDYNYRYLESENTILGCGVGSLDHLDDDLIGTYEETASFFRIENRTGFQHHF